MEPLWQAASVGSIAIITSELTWLETLTKPLRDQDSQLEALFRAFLSAQEVTLLPATLPMWEQAARPCALFITNDPIFRRVPNLPVVVLADVLRS